MSLPKKLILRMLAYIVVLGYMTLDVMVFDGPLSRALSAPRPDSKELVAVAKAEGVVARAYYQPIYRAQVEESLREYLWRRGRDVSDLSVGERKMLREAVLADLLDELLIKIQIKVSGMNDYPISDGEKKAAIERFYARYENSETLDELMALQGWKGGDREVEMRLAGRLQREKYLVDQLIPWNREGSSEKVKAWYDENKELLKSEGGDVPEFVDVEQRVFEALKAQQREQGMADFRKILRNKTKEKGKPKIEIFRDVLHAEEVEDAPQK